MMVVYLIRFLSCFNFYLIETKEIATREMEFSKLTKKMIHIKFW